MVTASSVFTIGTVAALFCVYDGTLSKVKPQTAAASFGVYGGPYGRSSLKLQQILYLSWDLIGGQASNCSSIILCYDVTFWEAKPQIVVASVCVYGGTLREVKPQIVVTSVCVYGGNYGDSNILCLW